MKKCTFLPPKWSRKFPDSKHNQIQELSYTKTQKQNAYTRLIASMTPTVDIHTHTHKHMLIAILHNFVLR